MRWRSFVSNVGVGSVSGNVCVCSPPTRACISTAHAQTHTNATHTHIHTQLQTNAHTLVNAESGQKAPKPHQYFFCDWDESGQKGPPTSDRVGGSARESGPKAGTTRRKRPQGASDLHRRSKRGARLHNDQNLVLRVLDREKSCSQPWARAGTKRDTSWDKISQKARRRASPHR